MTFNIARFVYFGLLSIAVVGCGSDDPEPVPGPGAFAKDFATNASFFTNMTAAKLGSSPHKEVQIWYSTNVNGLIEESTFTVPVGTVSIKTANMDGIAGVDAYAVMVKKPAGYDTANGDWHYEMRMPDGTIMNDPMTNQPMSGPIPMCIECHAAAKAKDYLAGTTLR